MKGTAIIAAFILIVIGSFVVGGYLLYISGESRMTKKLNDSVKALYIAEAGLERKIYEIYQGNFDEIDEVPFPLPVLDTDITYKVVLDDDDDDDGDVDDDDDPDDDIDSSGTVFRVTSTGRYYQEERTVQQGVELVNIWDTSIFVAGLTAGQISGSPHVRGTVYVLGEESFIDNDGDNIFNPAVDEDDNGDGVIGHFSETYPAIAGTGAFFIGNHHYSVPGLQGLDHSSYSDIEDRVDTVYPDDTLNAELNVKYGTISLGGTTDVGTLSVPMDTVNVPDGFPDSYIGDRIHSDRYLYDRNRFSEKLRFPSLQDRNVTGGPTRLDNLYNESNSSGYYRSSDLTITPTSANFGTPGIDTFYKIDNTLYIDDNTVAYIDGNLTINTGSGGGPPSTRNNMYYDGTGVIVVTGTLTINTNLYTSGDNDAYPGGYAYPDNNIIGFMTPNNIILGETGNPNRQMMAIFYAEGNLDLTQGPVVAGTLMSDSLTIGTANNLTVFQVIDLWENLPDGMIYIPPVVAVDSWHEVF